MALAGLLDKAGFFQQGVRLQARAPAGAVNPLAPRASLSSPRATRASSSCLCNGGPSHVDTFDHKPKLYGLDGKSIQVKTFGRGGHKNEGRVVGPSGTSSRTASAGRW